jgi:hypothetical protein
MTIAAELSEAIEIVDGPFPLSEAAKFIDIAGAVNGARVAEQAAWRFGEPTQVVWILDKANAVARNKISFPQGKGVEAFRASVESFLGGDIQGAGRRPNGSYSAYGYDTNDGEIFADGPEMFAEGEWGYRSTQVFAAALDKAIEGDPPKVKIEPVQGTTGSGYKLTVNKSKDHYWAIARAAMKAEQARWAKEGLSPERGSGLKTPV